MTTQELKKLLIKYSPFKFEGGKDEYKFTENELFISNLNPVTYEITSDETFGFKINVKGLNPFQPNVKINFGESYEEITINYDKSKLQQFPLNTRSKETIQGFFILKSSNI